MLSSSKCFIRALPEPLKVKGPELQALAGGPACLLSFFWTSSSDEKIPTL
jgi:hypothetical protein